MRSSCAFKFTWSLFWGQKSSFFPPSSSFFAARGHPGVIWLVVTGFRRSRLNCVSIDCELSISAGANFPRGAFPSQTLHSQKWGLRMIVKVFLGFWLMNSVPSFRDSVSRKKLATARKPKGTQSAATTFGLSTLLEIVTPKIIDKFFFEKPQPVKLWNYLKKFWGAFFLSTRKIFYRSQNSA